MQPLYPLVVKHKRLPGQGLGGWASRPFATSLLVALLCLGCSKPGDDSEAKRSQIPEPPPGATVPDGLAIPIEIQGKVVRTITSEILAARQPDFADDDRKAWRLDRLLSDKEFPKGAVLEAESVDGVGISMHHPDTPESPLPVLTLTRRGEVIAAVIKENDPFPHYHGHGGRLRRPGDPMPRLLKPLVRLRVSSSQAPAAAVSGFPNLRLQIDDAAPVQISAALVDALPSSKVTGDSGGERTRWDLRDLVAAAAGPDAVLTKVVGEGEAVIALEDWANKSQAPVLQVNRRGALKFHWLSDKGEALSGGVRSVRLLQMHR